MSSISFVSCGRLSSTAAGYGGKERHEALAEVKAAHKATGTRHGARVK